MGRGVCAGIPRDSPIRAGGRTYTVLPKQRRHQLHSHIQSDPCLMSISRHHPKVGRHNHEEGKPSLRERKHTPFPHRSCLLCLPESPRHSSPKAFLSAAEGKILPVAHGLPASAALICSSDLPSSPSLDSKYAALQACSRSSSQSSKQSLSTKSPIHP